MLYSCYNKDKTGGLKKMNKYKIDYTMITCFISIFNNILKINGLKTFILLSIIASVIKIYKDFKENKRDIKKVKHIIAFITYLLLIIKI